MSRRFTAADLLLLLLVMAAAAGARSWYLTVCADGGQQEGPLRVQDRPPVLAGLPAETEMNGHKPPTELDALVENVKEHSWFGSLAPLSDAEEQTAHVAPGYYWLLALLDKADRWQLSSMQQTVQAFKISAVRSPNCCFVCPLQDCSLMIQTGIAQF